MRYAILLLLLTACSTTESSSDSSKNTPAEDCLDNPALYSNWGECNVKKSIYDYMDPIRACLRKAKINHDVMLEIHVLPTGYVKNVRIEEKNRSLAHCLRKTFAKIKFASPPDGKKPVIHFPISAEMSGH